MIIIPITENIQELKFLLDTFQWSFSRINAYKTCERMFYLTYIKCLKTSSGFFAEFGSFGHSLLEKYYKKELDFFKLSKEYAEKYHETIKTKAPPNPYVDLNKKYYDVGKEYFDNFEGIFNDCEVLGVEEELKIKIEERDFIGYIDLILRDEYGIIIVDHKSKKMFESKKEKEEYLIQLYLYSIYIYEKYGEYPYKLVFNMFRENKIVEEKFDIKKLELAKKWVEDTISTIYKDLEFEVNKKEFFCNYICSVGYACRCSIKYLGE